jgi:hypothetical protein
VVGGALVVLALDDVVVAATVVLVVLLDVVELDDASESSSPLHAATPTTSTPAIATAANQDLERIALSVNEGPRSTIAALTTAREKS